MLIRCECWDLNDLDSVLFCQFLALLLWGNYLTSLSFSFFHKIGFDNSTCLSACVDGITLHLERQYLVQSKSEMNLSHNIVVKIK